MSAYITITGNLGGDPEERFTTSGAKVVEFSIANNFGKDDAKVTNWYRCSAFGKVGDACVERMHKGQRWTVSGVLRITEGKDGKQYQNVALDRFPEAMFSTDQKDGDVPF